MQGFAHAVLKVYFHIACQSVTHHALMHKLDLARVLLGHHAGQGAHVPAARKLVQFALTMTRNGTVVARQRSAVRSSGVRKACTQGKEAAKAVSSARKALGAAPGLLASSDAERGRGDRSAGATNDVDPVLGGIPTAAPELEVCRTLLTALHSDFGLVDI